MGGITMEYTKAELMTLAQEWDTLRSDLKYNKRMDFAQFNATFAKTYTLLSQTAVESTVDRALLPVIASAVLFTSNDSRELDNKFRAALTLTERMISSCAFQGAVEPPVGTMVYIFEMRKDVYIDFTNVNESVTRIEKLFEQEFWRNL
jgi:hypothetical protein